MSLYRYDLMMDIAEWPWVFPAGRDANVISVKNRILNLCLTFGFDNYCHIGVLLYQSDNADIFYPEEGAIVASSG